MSRNRPIPAILGLLTLAIAAPIFPALARGSCYEGNGFPEEKGWIRRGSESAWRNLEDGWFVQQIRPWYDPPVMNGGDHDSYLGDLSGYGGAPFFAEWRMMSDAPAAEVDHHNGAALMVLVGGPVTYHFNMANGLARLIRGIQFPDLYFIIQPDIPHTYRLEVFGAEWFEFYIDGVLAAADVPEGLFPTGDALMSFGGTYYLAGHTTRWDYVRYATIPADGSGDFDSDGDRDLFDFYFIHECLGQGPPGDDAGPGCRFADLDDDTDVDLHDFALFQNAFTGDD